MNKSEREAMRRQRLRQRLMDLAIGANNGCSLEGPCEVDGDCFTAMDPKAFFGFVLAVRSQFPAPENVAIYDLWQLHHFATIDTAVEHLLERGVKV